MPPKIIPVVGEVINGVTATGNWEVRVKGGKNITYWEFTCPLGCHRMLPIAKVRFGHTGCGCVRKCVPEIKLYGYLVPTGKIEYRDSPTSNSMGWKLQQPYWECRCTRCYKMCFKLGYRVKSGDTTTCGCLQEEVRKRPRARIVDHRNTAIVTLMSGYRHQATKRGYCWELTREQFETITSQSCHYCGVIPLQSQAYRSRDVEVLDAYIYNGIDRQDNSQGYVSTNVVPCCGVCNRTKMGDSVEQFLAHVERICNHSIAKEHIEAPKQASI